MPHSPLETMRRPLRTLFTLLLALSLLGGWTAQAAECGGTCCGAQAPAPEPLGQARAMGFELASGCDCCAAEAPPCDLEQAPAPDVPPRALGTAPKLEPPATAQLAFGTTLPVPENVPVGQRHCAADPPGRSPPDPFYLLHLAFLC